MQNKVNMEVLDLTEDTSEEFTVKPEPSSPVKDIGNVSDSEMGESSGLHTSPSGKSFRDINKVLDKAVVEIRKGQSLVVVASHFGISEDLLYNKLISRSLPREMDILTENEESNLVKWILRENKNNILTFKHQLMERVGRLKKVLKITPVFAKSKFGRMWYDYFMKNHPSIYENDGILLPSSDQEPAQTIPKDVDKKQEIRTPLQETDILTPEEENNLVNWILTSNSNNTLVFKYQLMAKVGKMDKVAKLTPGFAKSKLGKIWFEKFLKNHPEVYENDELLLSSDNVPNQSCNQWPDEQDIELAHKTFKSEPDNILKHPNALLLSYGIKDAVVILHDFRKEEKPPFIIDEKKNGLVEKLSESDLKNDIDLKEESEEVIDVTCDSPFEYFDKSSFESDQENSEHNEDDMPYKPNKHLRKKKNIRNLNQDRPVCKKCSRSFCNISKLKRHMLTVHQSKELYTITCTLCLKTFASKYHLTVHLKNSHNPTYYKCDECNKHFKHNTSLRKHKRQIHDGCLDSTNIFFCDICEKSFKYKNSLEAHIIYGHLKEKKRFSCNICKQAFVKHSAMLRHKTRHTKVRPMTCMYCKKTFSRKYLLRNHVEECLLQQEETKIAEDCEKIIKEYLKEIAID